MLLGPPKLIVCLLVSQMQHELSYDTVLPVTATVLASQSRWSRA